MTAAQFGIPEVDSTASDFATFGAVHLEVTDVDLAGQPVSQRVLHQRLQDQHRYLKVSGGIISGDEDLESILEAYTLNVEVRLHQRQLVSDGMPHAIGIQHPSQQRAHVGDERDGFVVS